MGVRTELIVNANLAEDSTLGFWQQIKEERCYFLRLVLCNREIPTTTGSNPIFHPSLVETTTHHSRIQKCFSDLPLYVVNLYGLWREKLSCFIQDIQTIVFFIGLLTLFLTIRSYLGFGLPIQSLL